MEQCKLPGPIITKLGMTDYVGGPYWQANFSQILLGGEFQANSWNNISVAFCSVPFFG